MISWSTEIREMGFYWCQWLVILGGVLAEVAATSQTCTHVNHRQVSCAPGDGGTGDIAVSLACPNKYMMQLRTVEYRISDSASCPKSQTKVSGDSCLVRNALPDLAARCQKKESCRVTVRRQGKPANCPLTGRVHYIDVILSCEPLFYYNMERAAVAVMNRADVRLDNHIVYLMSHSTVIQGTTGYSDTSKGCRVDLPPHTQVFIQATIFRKVPPQSGTNRCDQRVVVYDNAEFRVVFCERTAPNVRVAGCGHTSHTLFIRYFNDDPTVTVGFKLSLAASHQAAEFDITCGHSVDQFPQFVPASTPTPTHDSTSELPHDNSTLIPVLAYDNSTLKSVGAATQADDNKLIIMLVCIAAALAVMVGVIALLIHRHRSDKSHKKPTQKVEDVEGSRNFAYIGDVYLDGDSTLKLVRDKKGAFRQNNALSSRI